MTTPVSTPKAVILALVAGIHGPVHSSDLNGEDASRLQAPMGPGVKPRDDRGVGTGIVK
jgi:hypothetical protein